MADERAKKHTILAERLLAQLRVEGNGRYRPTTPSATNAIGNSLVVEKVPERRLEDIMLPDGAREVICNLVQEQHRADLLRSYNLEPRNRVLLAGPPGNGKTTTSGSYCECPQCAVHRRSLRRGYRQLSR